MTDFSLQLFDDVLMISSGAESEEGDVTEAVSTVLEPEPATNAGFALALWSRLNSR